MKEGKELKQLGSNQTDYKYDEPSTLILETFKNKAPHRPYEVEFKFDEFTSLCPKTGQPDFAEITILYVPNASCIESKSLKLYYFSYRNYGSFMESITNKMLDDFVKVCSPKRMTVRAKFKPRGGIFTYVEANYQEPPRAS